MVEDDGAVLCTFIRALAVERGGVVRLPEDAEKLVEGNPSRVKNDLRDLRMAGGAFADLMIGGILSLAAGKAAGDGNDTGQAFEDGFHAPEAAAAKGGGFSFIRAHNSEGCAFAKKPATKASRVIKIVFIVLHIRRVEIGKPYSESFNLSPACPDNRPAEVRRIFSKMLRLKRFRYGVFAAEPFAKIHQLAAVGTKRTVFAGEPVAGLFCRSGT